MTPEQLTRLLDGVKETTARIMREQRDESTEWKEEIEWSNRIMADQANTIKRLEAELAAAKAEQAKYEAPMAHQQLEDLKQELADISSVLPANDNPKMPLHTRIISMVRALTKELAEAKKELTTVNAGYAHMHKLLPKEYHRSNPLETRISKLVEEWQRGIGIQQKLETELAAAKQSNINKDRRIGVYEEECDAAQYQVELLKQELAEVKALTDTEREESLQQQLVEAKQSFANCAELGQEREKLNTELQQILVTYHSELATLRPAAEAWNTMFNIRVNCLHYVVTGEWVVVTTGGRVTRHKDPIEAVKLAAGKESE